MQAHSWSVVKLFINYIVKFSSQNASTKENNVIFYLQLFNLARLISSDLTIIWFASYMSSDKLVFF